MNIKVVRLFIGVIIVLVTNMGGAQATPVQFTFKDTVGGSAPCYLNSTCPLMPGVNVGDLITVTVIADNGESSLINQSWNQSNVISAFATIGSTYNGVFNAPFYTVYDTIFSTDGTGNLNSAQFYDTDNGNLDSFGNSITLSSNAITSEKSGSIQYWAFFEHGTSNSPAKLQYWSISAVPEAETYLMILSGLVIMGFILRRREFE